jgi:hypothetical protein
VDVSGTGTVTTTTGSTTGGTTPPVGGGGGGGGSVGPSGPTPEQQEIANMVADLQAVHTDLTPEGLTAVQAAEANLKALTPGEWDTIIYPDSTPNPDVVSAVSSVVGLLTYTGVTQDPNTAVNDTLDQLNTVYPNITEDDLYDFFVSFKGALKGQIGDILSGDASKSTAIATALETAVSENTEFKGLLGNVGLSVDSLSQIWSNVEGQVDPDGSALNALISAAATAYTAGDLTS